MKQKIQTMAFILSILFIIMIQALIILDPFNFFRQNGITR